MTTFANTDAAQAFIDSADSRNTDSGIMKAIVSASNNIADAETIWEDGLGNFDNASLVAFIEIATGNGREASDDIYWGDQTLEQVVASNPNS